MKTQFHKFLINTAVLLLLLLLLPGRVLAENYTASTIRLLYYEGNVKVLDADGKSRTLMQNGRFGSGETMQTGKESTASVETMEAEDLSNFVVKQLMRDDKLYDRVEDATGLADEALNL